MDPAVDVWLISGGGSRFYQCLKPGTWPGGPVSPVANRWEHMPCPITTDGLRADFVAAPITNGFDLSFAKSHSCPPFPIQ
ncbi:MAG: hypothetical protein PHY23_02235 [Oscillospiraceae bacterium]|nr:hypothetical protein [Oscillospiraceae bacterium]